jgi:PadR family transcriptional regulator PadR
MTNPHFMNGVPELLILRLLDEREMYGYELVRAIRTQTGDAISLGEGVVYPILHALERNRSLSARRKTVNGRTRVYYRATGNGKKRLAGMIGDWNRIAGALRPLIAEVQNAPAV